MQRSVGALVALVLAVPLAAAQGVLWRFPTDSVGVPALAGDLDGDGVDDYLFSDPRGSGVGSLGVVRAYSGADGAILYTVSGNAPSDDFGARMTALEDLDGDGVPDFAVAASASIWPPAVGPYVRVVSGASGATVYEMTTAPGTYGFGGSLSSLGDVDGDGAGDLAIGSSSVFCPDGCVELVSGASGTVLRTLQPTVAGTSFGGALARYPDLDQDGVDELLVGAPAGDVVHVISPVTSVVLQTLAGPPSSNFGKSVSAAGDVDGDGVEDVVVGAPGLSHGVFTSGSAFVLSGVGWGQIHRIDAAPLEVSVGDQVAAYDDLDGDGRDEFVVIFASRKLGGSAYTLGDLRVHSGLDASVLYTFPAGARPMASAGDVDGDGRSDFLIAGGEFYPERADHVVLAGAQPPVFGYGGGGSPEGCVPALYSSGAPSVTTGTDLVLDARSFPAGRRGFVFWGLAPHSRPFGAGNLLVKAPFVRMPRRAMVDQTGSCPGTLQQPFTRAYMAQHGLTPGTVVYAQAYGYGPTGPQGFAISNLLTITIWP
jgi:hypothetical protein